MSGGPSGLASLFGLKPNDGASLLPPSAAPAGSPAPPSRDPKDDKKKDNKIVVESGFDPTALERGAKAMRELDASANGKLALELSAQQERTRQIELQAQIQAQQAAAAQARALGAEREGEEERKTTTHREESERRTAQYKSQLQRQLDEKKREDQRVLQEEMLQKQEEQFQRHEQQRLANEKRIEDLRRQSAKQQAELDRETQAAHIAAKGRVERENHDVRKAMMRAEKAEDRQTRLEAVREQMVLFGEGGKAFLADPQKIVAAVVSLSALALGVYAARTTVGVFGRHVEKLLGKPSLVRETSAATNALTLVKSLVAPPRAERVLERVVLAPELQQRMQLIAASTMSTKRNGAPFRHVLLHGPPGTGKTLYAKQLAAHAGMDYAIMTGADVAPLGAEAVTEMHKLFDWAQVSRRGLLLFVDEADAFLRKGRDDSAMSETMRNVLSAFLYRTGTESDKFALVFATNQPHLLDSAIIDRVDEIVHFGLPAQPERELLLKQFYRQYLAPPPPAGLAFWKKQRTPIDTSQLSEDAYATLAAKTDGWSGRQLAKLTINLQATVYGGGGTLSPAMAEQVLDTRQREMKHSWMGREDEGKRR